MSVLPPSPQAQRLGLLGRQRCLPLQPAGAPAPLPHPHPLPRARAPGFRAACPASPASETDDGR
jgi:hypothetical protein